MILLDTHIWRWWVSDDPKLTDDQREIVRTSASQGLAVSVISCWEIAKAVENGKLALSVPVGEWIEAAVQFPDVLLLPLTPRIAVESTQLPQPIHRDPGDQLIIATARVHDCALLTADEKILTYSHVKLARRAGS